DLPYQSWKSCTSSTCSSVASDAWTSLSTCSPAATASSLPVRGLAGAMSVTDAVPTIGGVSVLMLFMGMLRDRGQRPGVSGQRSEVSGQLKVTGDELSSQTGSQGDGHDVERGDDQDQQQRGGEDQ